MLVGSFSSITFAQQVEERPVTIQERPIQPLDVEDDVNDLGSETLPTTNDRPIQISEVERPERAQMESVQEARNLRSQEARERSIVNQRTVTQVREIQAEEIRERQDIFNARVREIADEARRERVERLAENINRLNENLSARYDGLLNAMELVLDKIEIRTGIIEENTEVDLSTTYSTIDDSRDVIINARDRILEQRTKIYVVDLDSEDTMNEDFRVTMQEMREDHNILRTEVIDPLQIMVRDIMVTVREVLENDNR